MNECSEFTFRTLAVQCLSFSVLSSISYAALFDNPATYKKFFVGDYVHTFSCRAIVVHPEVRCTVVR